MRTRDEILQGENEKVFLTGCYFNLERWGKQVLGLELKPFHKDWLKILVNHDRIAISAPTGFGKTTIFGHLYPLWMAYFKPGSISVIVAKSIRTQSANILEDIKTIIENNEILKELIPKDARTAWTKEKLVTSNGSKIFYSSNSVNIRGIQADYVFADEVATYDNHTLFYRDIITRVISKKGKVAAVSTPIHTNDLLASIMSKPGFFSQTYPALIDSEGRASLSGVSIWPERFHEKYLLKERDTLGIANFERNYMCNAKAEAESPFISLSAVEDCYDLSRTFTTKTEGSEENQIYVGCDFAYSSGPQADFDTFIVAEYIGDKIILIHGERHKGMPIPTKYARLRELRRIYNPTRFVMDESNVGHGIVQQLRSEGFPIECQPFHSQARRKILIDLKELIENKRIIIPRSGENPMTVTFTNKLTEELIGFSDEESKITKTRHLISSAAHDDTVMSLAMVCKGASKSSRGWEDFVAVGN